MADADGKVTNEETALMFVELVRFGVVSEDKSKKLLLMSQANSLQQKHVASFPK